MRYRIKDLAPGLDGLIVEVERDVPGFATLPITKISNESVIVGDRAVSIPIAEDKLHISRSCLQKIDETPREYAHNNPFGKVLFEGRCGRGSLEAVYTQYENGLAVTVRELIPESWKTPDAGSMRTKYAQNFFGNEAYIRSIKIAIEEAFADEASAEDLIFELRDIKEQED